MPGRVVTVTGLGDLKSIEQAFRNAGLVVNESADTMVNSSQRAGAAAAAQAKEMGASADQQEAAAGRAAAAYVDAQDAMSRSQKAAATAAASAAKAMGLSADEQAAAADRAAVASEASGGRIGKAFDDGTSKAGGALERLGSSLGGWGIPFSGSIEKMGKSFDAAQSKGEKFSSAMSSLGKVTLIAGAGGLAAVGVEAVKMGEEYESAQAKIQGATGVTQQSAQQLTHAFGDTAGKFESSGEQMEGAYAGVAGQLQATEGHALSTAQAMKVMAAATELNTAVQGDLSATTASLGAVMQAFHAPASQASAVSDDLYNVSTRLDVPIGSLSTAMDKLHSRLGALAPGLGETGGLMVALGGHGITGSRGVQVVTSGLTKLVGGSEKTTEVLKDLGVSVFNAQGKFIGIQGVISQLGPKLDELNPKQRLFAEQTLFGAGANQVLGSVMQSGVPAYQRATDAATKMGTAHAAAGKQAETLHGELETAKAAVETLGGDLGLILIPDLQKLAKVLAEGVTWLEQHKVAAEALGAVIATVLGAAVAVFVEQKAVAFGKSIITMGEDATKLASSLVTTTQKIVAQFTAQGAAADASASTQATAEATMATDAEATAGKMQMSFGEIDTGFAGTATAAETASGDIVTANEVAGASFTAMLGPIGLVAAALAGIIVEHEKIINLIAGEKAGTSNSQEAGAIAHAEREQGVTGGSVHHQGEFAKFENTLRDRQTVAAAKKFGVPASALWGVYGNETDYGKDIKTSSTGAEGGFQFEPGTAKQYGYPMTNEPTGPQFQKQAEAAAHYLHDLIAQFHGNVKDALAAYNAGPGNIAAGQGYAEEALQEGAVQQLPLRPDERNGQQKSDRKG